MRFSLDSDRDAPDEEFEQIRDEDLMLDQDSYD